MDGNNATMQANRPFYNIRQSFNGFDSQLTFAVEKKVAKVARVTVSPNQVNIVENVKHLLSIGYKSIMIALATNVPWQKETIDKIYHTLSDFYIETARAGSILPLQVTNQLLLAKHEIQHDKYEPPTSGFCGAGKEMLGVSPNGDLYPCHRFTHSGKEYLLGNVFNGIEHTKREPFLQVTTSTLHHEMCNSCLALQYCPGSCMAANLLDSGDTFYPESRHCLELRAHVYNVDRIYNELINDCPPFISFLTEAWRSKREKALMSLLSELSE
ncbi:MAG: SPASM domain-containing protein [Blastocatellia bacterium]|nr:SPASM domain-containing protein [Blastocatellia bacterium]